MFLKKVGIIFFFLTIFLPDFYLVSVPIAAGCGVGYIKTRSILWEMRDKHGSR
ncbi:MAG: hypothetical protein LBL44_02990 [Treponema sp.]|nr:hypothetical protein [Treponema sp.]